MTEKWEFREDGFEKIRLIPEVAEEYKNLDGSIRVALDKSR